MLQRAQQFLAVDENALSCVLCLNEFLLVLQDRGHAVFSFLEGVLQILRRSRPSWSCTGAMFSSWLPLINPSRLSWKVLVSLANRNATSGSTSSFDKSALAFFTSFCVVITRRPAAHTART